MEIKESGKPSITLQTPMNGGGGVKSSNDIKGRETLSSTNTQFAFDLFQCFLVRSQHHN